MQLPTESFLCCLLSASTILQAIALQRDALQPSDDADGTPGDALLFGTKDHGFLGNPRPEGCYVRMPSECPKSPTKTSMWWKDVWAKQHGLDEPGCIGRKKFWDLYCESADSKMEYVRHETIAQPRLQAGVDVDAMGLPASPPGYPSQPGCYVRMPSKCHEPMRTNLWRHDAWAEKRGLRETDCRDRKEFWDRYCEAEDSQMEYIEDPGWGDGPEGSTTQPRTKADNDISQPRTQPRYEADTDSLGLTAEVSQPRTEADTDIIQADADISQPRTEADTDIIQADADISQPRTKADTDIISGYPSQPGCYMRMPSKCPANPMKTSMWRHDAWAEQHRLAGPNCEDRKGFWDRYCEADDTKIAYISQ